MTPDRTYSRNCCSALGTLYIGASEWMGGLFSNVVSKVTVVSSLLCLCVSGCDQHVS